MTACGLRSRRRGMMRIRQRHADRSAESRYPCCDRTMLFSSPLANGSWHNLFHESHCAHPSSHGRQCIVWASLPSVARHGRTGRLPSCGRRSVHSPSTGDRTGEAASCSHRDRSGSSFRGDPDAGLSSRGPIRRPKFLGMARLEQMDLSRRISSPIYPMAPLSTMARASTRVWFGAVV